MATNTDFDSLIQRIEVATETLEEDVGTLSSAKEDVEQLAEAFTESAQQAVTQAQEASTSASQSADESGASAQAAVEASQDAQALVTQLEAAVVIEEAPEDGQTYGRKDGTWVIGGGSGGEGTVTSVNGVTPNESGEVTLEATSIGALPDTYTPAWDDVTDKPTFSSVATTGSYEDLTGTPTIPTSNNDLANDRGFIADAPEDGEQYARKDGAWTVVEAGESGAAPIPLVAVAPVTTYYLDNSAVTSFTSNPYETVAIDSVGAYVSGRYVVGEDWFDQSAARINALPSGDYWFDNNTFSSGALNSKRGWMSVRVTGLYTTVIANIVQNAAGASSPTVYTYNYLSGWRAGFDGS